MGPLPSSQSFTEDFPSQPLHGAELNEPVLVRLLHAANQRR